MKIKSPTERYRKCAGNVTPIPTPVDDEGNRSIVQPDSGIGSKMEPSTYQAVVDDLSKGMGILAVAAKHGVGSSTVHLLRKRHADICPGHRKVMLQKMEEIKEQLVESMRDDLDAGKMPRGVKPVAFGIISDKYAAQEANGVVRHQHLHAFVPQNDVNSMLSGLAGDKESPCSPKNAQENDTFHDLGPNMAQNNPGKEPPSGQKGGEGGLE